METLNTLRIVSFIVYSTIVAVLLVSVGTMGWNKFKSRVLVPHEKVAISAFTTIFFLVAFFNTVSAIYNNNLNIVQNDYAKQNAEFYDTVFKYTEYYTVTFHIVIAVIYFILFLFFLYYLIATRRRKNPES
jgi:hypothetical protein